MDNVKKIYRTYSDTEVYSLAVDVKCPYCGEEWQEIDKIDCGHTYKLVCENDECEKEFEMYFDAS